MKLIALASFSLSFFDGLAGTDSITTAPLDPIPRVLADPVFHAGNNTLDLIVSEFSLEDPLDVYLGPLGPLPVSTWHSTASSDRLDPGLKCPAVPLDEAAKARGMVMSAFPSSVQHAIVVVDMPEPEDIVRAMQESKTEGDTGNNPPRQEQRTGQEVSPWGEVGRESPSDLGELTIQEALRNAESAGETSFTLSRLPFEDEDQKVIDPEAPATTRAEPASDSMIEGYTGSLGTQQVTNYDAPLITLSMPQPDNRESDLLPLPLLLVRRRDNVGFGTGRSVVAERLGSSEGFGVGKAMWGELVLWIL